MKAFKELIIKLAILMTILTLASKYHEEYNKLVTNKLVKDITPCITEEELNKRKSKNSAFPRCKDLKK